MGRKTSCSSKHGNPGRPKGHRYNQSARDSARMRGHEARDEIALVRKRAVKLSGLHGSINALVRKSNILTAANQRTTHMNVDEFGLNSKLSKTPNAISGATTRIWLLSRGHSPLKSARKS